MTEFDAVRFAAMFAANSQFNVGAGVAAEVAGDFHQAPHTFLIDGCKRICIDDIELGISGKKTAGIVSAHSHCGLCEIVRAKTKELGVARNLIRHQGSTRNFDHCSDEVFEFCCSFFRDLVRDAANDVDLQL